MFQLHDARHGPGQHHLLHRALRALQQHAAVDTHLELARAFEAHPRFQERGVRVWFLSDKGRRVPFRNPRHPNPTYRSLETVHEHFDFVIVHRYVITKDQQNRRITTAQVILREPFFLRESDDR